jgi:hypothetical protein
MAGGEADGDGGIGTTGAVAVRFWGSSEQVGLFRRFFLDGRDDADYSVESPVESRLPRLRLRYWNALAKRPMVLWRNVFVKIDPITEREPIQRRSRTVWEALWRGR